jgi:hypothetical protein
MMGKCDVHETDMIPTPLPALPGKVHCEKCVQEKQGFDPARIDAAIAGARPMTDPIADIGARHEADTRSNNFDLASVIAVERMHNDRATLLADHYRLQAIAEKMAGVLRTLRRHDLDCPSLDTERPGECDCGFDDALATWEAYKRKK